MADEAGQALAEIESSAQLVEAMKGVMAEKGWSIQDLVAAFGPLKVVSTGARPGTRLAKRKQYEQRHVEFDPEDLEAIERFSTAIEADLPEPGPDGYTQDQVDDLVRRIKSIRLVADLAEGRRGGIKLDVFQALDALVGEGQSGELVSAKEGWKLVREVAQGTPTYDPNVLEEKLDRKAWIAITDKVEERVINEEKLLAEFSKGKVPPDVMFEATIPATPVARFVPRALKDGEEV